MSTKKLSIQRKDYNLKEKTIDVENKHWFLMVNMCPEEWGMSEECLAAWCW